jgi:hypothetical protein
MHALCSTLVAVNFSLFLSIPGLAISSVQTFQGLVLQMQLQARLHVPTIFIQKSQDVMAAGGGLG